ncbi:MAG TPA: hypothetical protein PKD53_02325 [Chloroflexaceae bacterium]|nr:hypothetical protein [Chloroflexaceae bacterium]
MRYAEQLHPQLAPMRLVSRSGRLYTGPCPFCADGGEDRFHVWMEASGGRPAERYWCRVCDRRGLLKNLGTDDDRQQRAPRTSTPPPSRSRAAPNPQHIPFYRQLYAAVALWAHAWLLDPCHPEPLAYLHRRGLSDATINSYVLGVTLRDPESLVAHLRRECPEALPYAEEAGLVITDDSGRQLTHWNLRGRLIFPYIADGQVVDLRTRTYDGQKGYRSLGPYLERGATFPFGWDTVQPGTKRVIVAEAEFKALAALQAFHEGEVNDPTIGQPGLNVFRASWAEELHARGVEEVILCYDSQPRRSKDGVPCLAPEEQWSIRHGATCAAAGLQVRIARLPLAPGADKAEIDGFISEHRAARFQQLIDAAPLLHDYHAAIGQGLLARHHLPAPSAYPLRRPRPRRLSLSEMPTVYRERAAPSQSLVETRETIAAQVEEHATGGTGFLVLAHPPGIGKGHNTTLGLKRWLANTPTGDDGSGYLVWAALRKAQIDDQQGIPLIPLHGRGPQNCRKLPEVAVLAGKGYSVKDALCMRRCPFVDRCRYLRQFERQGDFFAPIPLLKATGWWEQAGVVVLDEFDPTSLVQHVQLDAADLAAMSRAHPKAPAIQTVLRWIAQAVATTLDRALAGSLLLDELVQQAQCERACFDDTLAAALDELPPPEQLNMLIGLPTGARLADYQALPPGHTATLLNQLAKEYKLQQQGKRFTSRVEARGGRLELYMRVEHLRAQLARADQPKIILDATANPELLRALFPTTSIRVERPHIPGAMRVVQVIGRDWAKTSLRARDGERGSRRRERWFDEVTGHIRPGRPTLVVCTRECEDELRAALVARGHDEVQVGHYGALRGSNAYQGHDVILAQVYHPNLEQVIREGRALFADDEKPLDERIMLAEPLLTDATGASWHVPVPTFADSRLAALLEQRREAELLQCALRGRPFDHPDVQITLLFGLPVPGLPPTVIVETAQSEQSNAGRERAVKVRLCAAAQQLLDGGVRVIDVEQLAKAALVSVVTTRKHWLHVATRLQLRSVRRRQLAAMPRGGQRSYERMVLMRRGRWVPPNVVPRQPAETPCAPSSCSSQGFEVPAMNDQARNQSCITRVIPRHTQLRRRRCRSSLARAQRESLPQTPPPDP